MATTNSRAFIERYFTEVSEWLNDPNLSVRNSSEKKLRMLGTFEKMIWERLLPASSEAVLGMTEAVIPIQNGKRFYPLPGNFRKFIRLERRLEGDPNRVQSILPTKHVHSTEPGVILISALKGFEIDPSPILAAEQDWTLIYHKGSVNHHYGVAKDINPLSLSSDSVVQGTISGIDNFYAGSLLRVFDADTGAPQVLVVDSYSGPGRSFQFRFPFDPLPTGSKVWYETMPVLDEGLDSLYAVDVAMAILAQRKMSRQRNLLMNTRMELLSAAKQQFQSLTSDRGPERSLPIDVDEPSTGTEPWR